MKLAQALEEYGLLLRRRHRGEEGRRAAGALEALSEYLDEYAGLEETTAVTPQDLYQFILDYYPSQETPDAEVALALLEVSSGFGLWLIERGERGLAPFVEDEPRLREDLPRVIEALDLLREHASRDRLTPGVEASLDGEDEEEEDTATVSSGMDRVADLNRIRYAEAEEERFTVLRVEEGALALQTAAREVLEQPPAEPVQVPSAASERLRVSDIIHAEIAPGPEGWEMLEVFGVRPGGYP